MCGALSRKEWHSLCSSFFYYSFSFSVGKITVSSTPSHDTLHKLKPNSTNVIPFSVPLQTFHILATCTLQRRSKFWINSIFIFQWTLPQCNRAQTLSLKVPRARVKRSVFSVRRSPGAAGELDYELRESERKKERKKFRGKNSKILFFERWFSCISQYLTFSFASSLLCTTDAHGKKNDHKGREKTKAIQEKDQKRTGEKKRLSPSLL